MTLQKAHMTSKNVYNKVLNIDVNLCNKNCKKFAWFVYFSLIKSVPFR